MPKKWMFVQTVPRSSSNRVSQKRGGGCGIYRLDLATRSSSSFFLMAYELDEPLAALISSSARHSAIDLTLRKADSRVYVNRKRRVLSIRREGKARHG